MISEYLSGRWFCFGSSTKRLGGICLLRYLLWIHVLHRVRPSNSFHWSRLHTPVSAHSRCSDSECCVFSISWKLLRLTWAKRPTFSRSRIRRSRVYFVVYVATQHGARNELFARENLMRSSTCQTCCTKMPAQCSLVKEYSTWFSLR